MANGDTATQDERENREPTPDELRAAEQAKTQQALALVDAAKQEEASLVTPPRNRTYMGPNIGGPTNPQQFFGPSLPQGTVIVPPAMRNPTPLSPEDQAAVQHRISLATSPESNPAALARMRTLDRPGTRTIGVSNPPMPVPSAGQMQFEAQQGYLKDINGGMEPVKARDKWLPLMLSGRTPTGMLTDYQSIQTKLRQQELDQKAKAESDRIAHLKPPGLPTGLINTHKALIAQWVAEPDPAAKQARKAELDAFVQQHPELMGGTASTPATTGNATLKSPAARTIKDKNGKEWIYTGTASDYKTDKDKSHWKAK